MIKIVPKFTRKEIEAMVLDRKQRIEQASLMLLKRAGENFVRNARDLGQYTDRTGNLRSSTGYIILKNGERIQESFRSAFRGKRGNQGPDEARKVLEDIAKEYKTGYVLIGVAGMNYAAAVESKGYDVLTSSAQIAKEELEQSIARLKLKIPNMR